MDFKNNKWVLLTLIICPLILLVGVFEAGRIIGQMAYASESAESSISMAHVGLFGSAIWAASELYRSIQKLKLIKQSVSE